jgi:alginate O-acetyltransferase complex protein AlgI
VPFSSTLFLFGFLPIFLALYHLAPRSWKNGVALAASLLFYAWGAPQFLMVLVAVSAVDYAFSWRIAARAPGRPRAALLAVAVTLNLSLLFYFKYANFVARESSSLLVTLFHARPFSWIPVALPMGISFVVFEEISYLVDVYRGVSAPARRFSDYALFLSLFPHSIAGPIFRWHDLEAQLRSRVHSLDAAFDGFLRFCFGLAKKALVANQVAVVADAVFGHDLATLPSAYAWIGLLAYTLQIYFDFSGYSDMAIGLGKMIGFTFKENFESPYAATSITEFWRRWHISLSTWLRDYLYIPLGGNRVPTLRRYRNLVVVFLLCGLWHGANWTFVAWGAYHGGLLVLERLPVHRRLASALPRALGLAVTFVLVMLGWVFFRSESLPDAFAFFARLFAADAGSTPISWGELLPNRAVVFGVAGLVGCFAAAFAPVERGCAWLIGKRRRLREPTAAELARWLVAAGALALSATSLVNSRFNPFIYFRF